MLLNINLSAQPGSIQWENNYGGSEYDKAYSIQQTDDGGYIVAGYSETADGDVSGNNGSMDYWLVKLGPSGIIQWARNYGGSSYDIANSVQETNDGGYIVVGESLSDDGDVSGNNGSGNVPSSDYWLVKLDENGNILWEENYGGSNDDNAYSVQQTNDGGYIVAGKSESNDGNVSENKGDYDFWLVKVNSNGNIEWEENYGGSDADVAYSVQQTVDGGYIVAGLSSSDDGDVSDNNFSSDYWVVKLDSSGTIQWEDNYGGTNSDIANSVKQTEDGGYIVAGYSDSNDGNVPATYTFNDYWIVKLNPTGNVQWTGKYGGVDKDRAKSVQQTDDGGYIVAGQSESDDGDVSGNNGYRDYWLVKVDSTGDIEWEGNYGGSFDDEAFSVKQTNDGGYIVAGHSETADGDVSGSNGFADFWVVKLNGTLSTENLSSDGEIQTSLYPNPTRNNITVEANGAKAPLKVILRDITGRKFSDHKIENPSNFQIEIAQEAGIYMLELKDAAGRKTTRKVIKK